MNTRRLVASLTLAVSVLALAACAGGNGSSGFVPAGSQPSSAHRTPKDEMVPHF
ncbi:MAG: hypothetical protein M3N19_10730 [Candidatus Eremiobacteraeota bacterium]|nr:hypothetical protein [Candidatus Eremiobacteraeota bacterium]